MSLLQQLSVAAQGMGNELLHTATPLSHHAAPPHLSTWLLSFAQLRLQHNSEQPPRNQISNRQEQMQCRCCCNSWRLQ